MNIFFRITLVALIFIFCAPVFLFSAEENLKVTSTKTKVTIDTSSAETFSTMIVSFWETPTSALLSALGWDLRRWERTESLSEKKNALYTINFKEEKFFGIPVEQIKIEEEKGTPARIEIMFFNKGDTAAKQGFGTDSSKSTEEKNEFVKNEWKLSISATDKVLSVLGKKQRCSIGSGKMRRRAEIRMHNKNAFITDAEKNEFVRIIIVSEKRVGELTCAAITDRVKGTFSDNVERRENGDVLIGNIPMINQGEKGYCVPATVERTLRYFGVNGVDMHQIADLAGTKVGGGTSLLGVINGLTPVIKKYRLEFSKQKMTLQKIRQSIDRGYPILWTMYSVPDYISRMEENTRTRVMEKDFSVYVKKLNTLKKFDFSGMNLKEFAHMCLIIGYNMQTKELCVSDSWGKNAQEEWIRFEDALAVTQTTTLYILKN